MWIALFLSACSTPTPSETPASPADPSAATPPGDAAAEGAARAAEGRAGKDRPPTIAAITLSPEAPTAADTLVAKAEATDREGARLDFDYAWYVNDAPIPDVASEQLAGRFKKGDRVRVRVTVDDGTNEVSAESEPLAIANATPVFETGARDVTKVDGFAFRASDPDGDPLTWTLEGGPKRMSISSDGVLAFPGVAEDEPGGRYVVKVTASDGDAFGVFEFPLTVTPGQKVQGAAR